MSVKRAASAAARTPPSKAQLLQLLRRFRKVRVLVVGDVMMDQFIWGRVERISPEAPVPVVHVTGESFHLGGAANVAQNIIALGGQATLCSVVGRDPTGRLLQRQLREIGIGGAGVVAAKGVMTVRKTRIIAHSQQVVRFDRERVDGMPSVRSQVLRYLQRRIHSFDAVVVSDYGKGVITEELLDMLRAARERRPFRLIVDPKKPNFERYRGITLAAPNTLEASEASGVAIRDLSSLRRAGAALLETWDAEAVLITRGEEGMSLFSRRGRVRHFPTEARQVFDVTGAGDTVVAVCAAALGAGASFDEAAALANHAAGIVVGKVGTAAATVPELRAQIEAAQRRKIPPTRRAARRRRPGVGGRKARSERSRGKH